MAKTSPSAQTELTPLQQLKLTQWHAIRDHLKTWYAQPDLECLRACLSVYQSHFSTDAPIWMFLLGPPSMGKSEFCIGPLTNQPQSIPVSTITESSFISAYDPKCGILPNLKGKPKNGVLLFSDFSNFLSLSGEVRAKLQAQMREIYDGRYQKHAGNLQDALTWEGKVTILAACTPELERYWGLENSLGDRFLQIKLKQPDPELVYQFSEKQQTTTKQVLQKKTQNLINTFLDDIEDSPDIAPPNRAINRYLFDLLNICLQIRRTVFHNYKGEAEDVATLEGSPRFARMILNLAKTHAKLFAREEIGPVELKLMRRVCLDTCPSKRLNIILWLMNHTEPVTMHDLMTRFPGSSFDSIRRILDDLKLIQLVQIEKMYSDRYVILDSAFREKLHLAKISSLPL